MYDITQAFGVLVILLGVCSPIIVVGVVYYLKKRLEHKQIMAAIEKGTPLSEIMPPKPKPAGPAWIKYVSTGIALIIIGLGFTQYNPMNTNDVGMSIFMILCGVGIAMLIRGLLHRKYYLKNGISTENNSTEKEKSD
ncbi:MAG: DUF6249 domain-containing protein [Planctomycetota bacterium]|jgi:uncharacterized membrane protein HdeD (DUF308 family)